MERKGDTFCLAVVAQERRVTDDAVGTPLEMGFIALAVSSWTLCRDRDCHHLVASGVAGSRSGQIL